MSKKHEEQKSTTQKNNDVFDCEIDSSLISEQAAEASKDELAQEPESKTAPQEEKPAKDPLKDAQEALLEQKDKYLRLMAEFDNFKRRTAREFQQTVDTANERLMSDIIYIREDFERAMKAKDKAADLATFTDGMQLVFNRLDESLKKHGLEPFGIAGDSFDPQVHEAMMRMPHPSFAEDQVAEIFERGYKLKGKVIRHARVIVSSGKPDESAETKSTDTPQS